MMKRLTKWTITAIVVVVVLMGGVGAGKHCVDARFFDGYDPDWPLDSTVRERAEHEAYIREEILFSSMSGIRIPAVLALPPEADSTNPVPCIVFLHGIGQNKEFIDEIAAPFTQSGMAMISFDQHMRGQRRLDEPGPLEEALAFRRRAALTVIETRRTVDYLATRDDIDGERIYLVGASYGAVTGSTAAAFDTRFRAVVLVYGGGNIPVLVDSPLLRQELGDWTPLVARFANWYLAPGDPIQYIHQVSPRPILFQHGREDSVVPPESAQALYDAARESKRFIWYEGDHIGLDEDIVIQVLEDALAWLQDRDAQVLADERLTAE